MAALPAIAESTAREEIVLYLPGDAPPALPEVQQAIQDKANADGLNITLTIVFAGWDDYGGGLQMSLAAGQKRSLAYDATWGALSSNLASGFYENLDELLPKYAPNLVSTKGDAVLEANLFKGPDGEYHLYGIPLGDYHGRAMQFQVRKDLRETLGFAPIKSKEALIEFAYKVKDTYPGVTPIVNGRAAANTMAGMLSAFNLYDIPGYMWITPLGWDGVFYYKNNDGIAYNVFDDMPESCWQDILTARKLYLDGIIHPDVMTIPTWSDRITSGQAAIASGGDIGEPGGSVQTLLQYVPEGELEVVSFYDFSIDGAFATDYKAWDFLFVPSTNTDENKVRSLEFLNWVAASQENYDLCAFGVEGLTWEPVGDKQYTIYSDKWEWNSWTWCRNAVFERYDANYNETDLAAIDRFHDEAFFEKSVLTGFSFNADPVTNQISQYNVALSKYWYAIQDGAIDPDEGMAAFRDEAYDAVSIITAELQKQIDEFLGR
jgi:putative aldouronate transport system substrate-binding protein